MAGVVIFPLLSTAVTTGPIFFRSWDWIDNLVYLGFALLVFNLGLFLLLGNKKIASRRRVVIILAMVLLIGSSSPLFASDLENREDLITKLELVGKVLSQSDHERFIAILEAKPTSNIRLPELASGDSHFAVSRMVATNSPEYWYSLAALYTHEGMKGRTLEVTKTMIEKVQWSTSKEH